MFKIDKKEHHFPIEIICNKHDKFSDYLAFYVNDIVIYQTSSVGVNTLY